MKRDGAKEDVTKVGWCMAWWSDHPTPAAFPEGRYLKAMFLRVDA